VKTAVAKSSNAKIAKVAKVAERSGGTWHSTIAQRSWAPIGAAIFVGAQLCCAMSGVAFTFRVMPIFALPRRPFAFFLARFALTAVS
jgi:hypothetical protein